MSSPQPPAWPMPGSVYRIALKCKVAQPGAVFEGLACFEAGNLQLLEGTPFNFHVTHKPSGRVIYRCTAPFEVAAAMLERLARVADWSFTDPLSHEAVVATGKARRWLLDGTNAGVFDCGEGRTVLLIGETLAGFMTGVSMIGECVAPPSVAELEAKYAGTGLPDVVDRDRPGVLERYERN